MCDIRTFWSEVNQSNMYTGWRDFPRGTNYNSWAKGRFCVVCHIAWPQSPPAVAPLVDQHLQMAEAIVIGTKGVKVTEACKSLRVMIYGDCTFGKQKQLVSYKHRGPVAASPRTSWLHI